MAYTDNTRMFFIMSTILIIGSASVLRVGVIDLHGITTIGMTLVPAVIVMGLLGHKIGELLDNPKDKADADYKLDVLNALKKMDKSITMQELNDKLTKQVAEPDLPDADGLADE